MSVRTALRRLSAQSLGYGSANLSKKLLAFLLLPLYTSLLSPEDYGIISTVGVIVFLAGTVLSLKQDAAVLRLWYDYQGSAEERRTYLGTVIVLVASVALAGALLLSLFGRPFFDLLGKGLPFSYVVWGLWTGAAAALSLIPMMVLRVKEQAFRFVLLQAASFLLTAAPIVYFVVFRGEAALGQIKGMLFGSCAVLLVSLTLVVREARPGFSLRHARATLRYGVPLIPQGIAEWIIAGSDRVFLLYYGTLASVGMYSLGYTLGSAVNVMVFSLQQALGPFFFSTAGDRGQAETVLPRLATYATLAISVAVVLVSVFGREAVMVIADPRYAGAAGVVPLIASAYLVRPLALFSAYGILYRKRPLLLVLNVLVSAAANLILNFLLIPPYGTIGAAVATWLTCVGDAGITFWLARRIYPLPYEYRRLGQMFLLSGVIIGAGSLVPGEHVWVSLPLKLALVISYPLLLYAGGFFTGQELSGLWGLARRWVGGSGTGPARREG